MHRRTSAHRTPDQYRTQHAAPTTRPEARQESGTGNEVQFEFPHDVPSGVYEESVTIRSLARRRPHQPRRLEARVADDGSELRRRDAGCRRPCAGRPAARLHRERGDRHQLADLPRRHRLHGLALHRAGDPRVALRRRGRLRPRQQDRPAGVSHGDRHVPRHGADRLLRRADAARSRQRRTRGEGTGAAVPAHQLHVQHRHAAVLHAVRGAPRRRRCAHAAPARPDDDGAQCHPQRRPDSRPRADSVVRHCRVGDGHGDRVGHGQPLRALPPVPWRQRDPVLAIDGLEARLVDHQVAVPLRAADRRAGHRDEHRRRAAAALHRLAGAQRRGAGGLCHRLHRALLDDYVDVGWA